MSSESNVHQHCMLTVFPEHTFFTGAGVPLLTTVKLMWRLLFLFSQKLKVK